MQNFCALGEHVRELRVSWLVWLFESMINMHGVCECACMCDVCEGAAGLTMYEI